MSWLLLLLVTGSTLAPSASSHGRVLQPPSRASAWRRNFRTLADYDDNGVNCGGFGRQWSRNRGRCGVCGDPYDLKQPRPHEIGGKYGQGLIVARYPENSLITTITELTTSHRGFWEFRICPDPRINEQSCFARYLLRMQNGETKFYPKESRSYKVTYRLPKGLTCNHCVLQWKYTAGNNWGVCGNGRSMQGCGPQETFGACSDIQIFSNRSLVRKPGASVLQRVSNKKPMKISSILHSMTKKKVSLRVTPNTFLTLPRSIIKKKVSVRVIPNTFSTSSQRSVSKKKVPVRVTRNPLSISGRSMTPKKVLVRVTPNPSTSRRSITENKVSVRVTRSPLSTSRRTMTQKKVSLGVTPNPFSTLPRSMTKKKVSVRVTPNPLSTTRRSMTQKIFQVRATPNPSLTLPRSMTKKKVSVRVTPNPFSTSRRSVSKQKVLSRAEG